MSDIMADSATFDSDFLKATVGDALAKGVAATVEAQPDDPVEYLARYLLRQVQSNKLLRDHVRDNTAVLEGQAADLLKDQQEQKEADVVREAKESALKALVTMTGEPQHLWAEAVKLVRQYTRAAAAYVAVITDDEEADWVPPEDAETPDAETEDEADAPAAAEAEGGTGEEAAAAEGEEGGEGAGEGGVAAASKGSKPKDYSKKLLSYVCANEGQEFVEGVVLRRPAAGGEGEGGEEGGEGAGASKAPLTFSILDELRPMLEVPAVALEPRITFFRGLPKVGAYVAAAVPADGTDPSQGEFQAILAADTLLPEGNGQALPAEEVAFMWDVARALGQALDRVGGSLQRDLQGRAFGGDGSGPAAGVAKVAELKAALAEVRAAASAPAPVPEEGEAPAAPAEEEEGAALTPEQQVAAVQAALQYAEQQVAAGEVKVANATAALATADQALQLVIKAVNSVRAISVTTLRKFTASPPATAHVLRAVLLLLGRPAAKLGTWQGMLGYIMLPMFDDLTLYDAHGERDMALWAKVRRAIKGVRRPQDLEAELPHCAIGALLALWVTQVRRCAKAAAAKRAVEGALLVAQTTKEAKTAELEAAKQAQAQAEAAAAAAEAAAAAGGEEGAEEAQE